MTIERLKQFTYNTLVPEGYNMSFKQPTIEDLETLISIAESAKEELLVENVSQDVEDKEQMEFLLFKLHKSIKEDSSWIDSYIVCQQVKKAMFSIDAFYFLDALKGCNYYEEYVLRFYDAAKRHIEGM